MQNRAVTRRTKRMVAGCELRYRGLIPMSSKQATARGPAQLPRCVLYALALHAALIGFGSVSSCHTASTLPVASPREAPSEQLVNLDEQPPPPHPKTIDPGGGSPPPLRPVHAQAKTSASSKASLAKHPVERADPDDEEEEDDAADASALDGALAPEDAGAPESSVPEVPEFDPVKAALERRQRDFRAGTGRGSGGGPGGFGAGWGGKAVPMVHGDFAFGSGGSGAMKGIVCFIPEGTQRLADVTSCDPVAAFYANELNVPARAFSAGFPGIDNRFEWFAIDYQGTFTTSRPGEYTFRLLSDDGSYLYIDGQLLIDNDGMHGPESKIGVVNLPTGEHRIKVLYFQGHRMLLALQLFVRLPGNDAERLFGPRL